MMETMTAYARPGIAITEQYIKDLIKETFALKLYLWITIKSRVDEYCIPRQVLMSCLMDFLHYSESKAGEVCLRSRSDARHAHITINDTLMNDKVYGERVRLIYDHLKQIK